MTPKSTTAPRAGTMVNASEGCARATRCARANARWGGYMCARDDGRGRAKTRSGRDEGRTFEVGAIGVWDLEVGAKDDD